MIWKNFRRELFGTTSRLMSVMIISAVAVMVYIGLFGVVYNTDKILNDYFEQQNVADYWIAGTNLNQADCKKLAALPGVLQVEPQARIEAENRYDAKVTLMLFGVEGYGINAPLILEGRLPESSREMMISYSFAEKQGLQIGDIYQMKLAATGQIVKKQICALIKNPECMYHINASSLVPDYNRYGYAYMDYEALSDTFQNNYNQICITVKPGTDSGYIKEQVDRIIGNRLLNLQPLEDNLAVYHLFEQIDGLRPIVLVFPMIFFMVAILIMFSTMSRLIENARMSIGTMKALGYYDGTILLYYSLYAMLVVGLGFLLGSFPANMVLTTPVANTLFFMADMPTTQLVSDPNAWLAAFALTCVSCIGTAFLVTLRALREKPSECMRPRPPKVVKRLFIERIGIIWKRLNFSQKYIVRNMFRNKTRMFICVVGIAGCMTLILTSFTLNDSIDYLLGMLAQNEYRYDYVIGFDTGTTREQYTHIGNMEIVTQTQYEMSTSATLYSRGGQESAYFRVNEDISALKLIDTYGPAPSIMPNDGAVIQRKLADKLGVNVGESVTVKFANDSKYYTINVSQIIEATNGILVGKSYWRQMGREFVPNTLYVTTTDHETLVNRLGNYDFVDSVKDKNQITGDMESQVSSMAMVVFLLILFGGILALVVLYNLGIMSFYEQIRNLATLMVLGFYDKETRKLLLTENLVFSAVGILFGIPLGIALSGGILNAIGVFNFELDLRPLSYLFSTVITMMFAVIINIMLGSKMKKIDMLGALKSIE